MRTDATIRLRLRHLPSVSLPRARVLLIAGLVAWTVSIAGYLAFAATQPADHWLSPVDLHVYRLGGQIAAGLRPAYLRLPAPLYDWPGTGLKFTYTPAAALVFTLLTVPSWALLIKLSLGVSVAALLASVWFTLGGLGYRPGAARLGGTLLLSAALLWTEPVQRTLYLGQVELVLMALLLRDLSQPERRWWQGAGVGLAAGIKLVPLIFIPYLLLTRRYRQAGVAAGVFAVTIVAGFIILPADSQAWWLGGLFLRGSRTGFTGWEGNQSLQGLVTRLAGSIAGGRLAWLIIAAVTLVAGLAAAAVLDRAGHRLASVVTCALAGLLVSPISWDHHWVWVVPGITVLAAYAIRLRGFARRACVTGAAALAVIFAAWPGALWGQTFSVGGFPFGLIWIPPNTNPATFARLGDRPWYAEYHWHGADVVAGNLYVLAGAAALVLLCIVAVRAVRAADVLPGASRPATAPVVNARRFR